MLFLLKRSVATSLISLAVLVLLGLGLRQLVPAPTPLEYSPALLLAGVVIFGIVVCSDGLIHGTLWLLLGRRYMDRFEELAGIFRKQSLSAMLAGALMAGLGEELVFRGLPLSPGPVLGLAVLFGLLHHIRRQLWLFTLWSVWEGLLFALALLWMGTLLPTMVAHFLHDLGGFLLFRWTPGCLGLLGQDSDPDMGARNVRIGNPDPQC